MIKLSDRLQLIADEIKQGERVCDVGTDHGYLPLYLYENKIADHVIMTDISKGSLEKCKSDCELYFPDTEFDLRLGSGLEVLNNGEVDTVVMAGMGGILITELMGVDYYFAHTFKRYILQPRRHIGRLRYWLLDNDYTVVKEQLVREGKFIWPVLTVESFGRALSSHMDPDDIEFEYPITLLDFKNDLTFEYLNNALKLEKEKLESKKSGKNTTFEELRTQTHRVEYIEYLLNRI